MGFLFLLLLLLVLLWLFHRYLIRPLNYFSEQGVKTAPNALPGFGHVLPLFTFRENVSTLCIKLYELYCSKPNDRMLGIYYLTTPMLMIRDPELIRCVLVKEFNSFRNNATLLSLELDPFLAYNPFFAGDDLWREYRKQLVSRMSKKKLKSMYQIARGATLKFEKHLEKITSTTGVAELEFKGLCQKFTSEVVANTGFGVEGHAFEDKPDSRSFVAVMNTILQSSLTNTIRQFVSMYLHRLSRLLGVGFMPREASHFLRNTLTSVLRHRKENGHEAEDYLQMSIDGEEEDINEDAVVGRVSSYFFDAYETSASVAAFVCYQLSQHPEIQEKARREVREVLGRYENSEVSYEALEEMVYLERCVMETLRFHPILGIILRTCTQSVTLEDSKGQKCHLEPGHLLCIPVQNLHLDPEFWRDPEVFDPDRHSEERKDEVPKFAYLPFSIGPRICAGMRYGLMEVKIVMSRILRGYEVELSDRTRMPLRYDPMNFLTTADGGLWLKLRKLDDS